MNIYGRSTPETIKKLQNELGTTTWDAGNGLCPHMHGQQNDLIVVKLQGACDIEGMANTNHQETSFWSQFDREHIKTIERFKDDPNHEFHEEEISFEQWMKWYNKATENE